PFSFGMLHHPLRLMINPRVMTSGRAHALPLYTYTTRCLQFAIDSELFLAATALRVVTRCAARDCLSCRHPLWILDFSDQAGHSCRAAGHYRFASVAQWLS